jgi:hypothetical protein
MQADLSRLTKACCAPQKLPVLDGAPFDSSRSRWLYDLLKSLLHELFQLRSEHRSVETQTRLSVLVHVEVWS